MLRDADEWKNDYTFSPQSKTVILLAILLIALMGVLSSVF